MTSYGHVQGRIRYRLADCRFCVLYLARARARARARADGRPGPPRKRWGAGPPLQPLARRKLGTRAGAFVRACARACVREIAAIERWAFAFVVSFDVVFSMQHHSRCTLKHQLMIRYLQLRGVWRPFLKFA